MIFEEGVREPFTVGEGGRKVAEGGRKAWIGAVGDKASKRRAEEILIFRL